MFEVVAGTWTPYLLWLLATHGALRFGALQRLAAGISPKVLTDRLRTLERAGLVHRDQAATIPPQVTYTLTPRGAELQGALCELSGIAQRWDDEGWTPAGTAA